MWARSDVFFAVAWQLLITGFREEALHGTILELEAVVAQELPPNRPQDKHGGGMVPTVGPRAADPWPRFQVYPPRSLAEIALPTICSSHGRLLLASRWKRMLMALTLLWRRMAINSIATMPTTVYANACFAVYGSTIMISGLHATAVANHFARTARNIVCRHAYVARPIDPPVWHSA